MIYARLSKNRKVVECPECGAPLAWRDRRDDGEHVIRLDPDWRPVRGQARMLPDGNADPWPPGSRMERNWARRELGSPRRRRIAAIAGELIFVDLARQKHGSERLEPIDVVCRCSATVRVAPRRLEALTPLRSALAEARHDRV
jgi:hypothetical protein